MKTFSLTKLLRPVGTWIALGIVSTTLTMRSLAIPIDGAPIVVAADGNVVATYFGTTASYNSDLYLFSPSGAFTSIIFNNHGSTVGSIVDLGFFAAGTELIFRLHVNTTGLDFFSGDPSRNSDGLAHARVNDEFSSTQTLVEFEDLFGTPEGSLGFNDLRFGFTNVRSTPPVGVPDAGSTMALLSLSTLGIVGFMRRLTRQQ